MEDFDKPGTSADLFLLPPDEDELRNSIFLSEHKP
jgi:hypothetical protein